MEGVTGSTKREVEDVIASWRHTPIHGAIHDLFLHLDRVVLAIDFWQRWDASYGLPEEAVSQRQDI